MIITEQVWNKYLITNAPLSFTLTDVEPGTTPYVVFTLKDGAITRKAISSTVYLEIDTPAQMFAKNTLYQYPGPDPIKE